MCVHGRRHGKEPSTERAAGGMHRAHAGPGASGPRSSSARKRAWTRPRTCCQASSVSQPARAPAPHRRRPDPGRPSHAHARARHDSRARGSVARTRAAGYHAGAFAGSRSGHVLLRCTAAQEPALTHAPGYTRAHCLRGHMRLCSGVTAQGTETRPDAGCQGVRRGCAIPNHHAAQHTYALVGCARACALVAGRIARRPRQRRLHALVRQIAQLQERRLTIGHARKPAGLQCSAPGSTAGRARPYSMPCMSGQHRGVDKGRLSVRANLYSKSRRVAEEDRLSTAAGNPEPLTCVLNIDGSHDPRQTRMCACPSGVCKKPRNMSADSRAPVHVGGGGRRGARGGTPGRAALRCRVCARARAPARRSACSTHALPDSVKAPGAIATCPGEFGYDCRSRRASALREAPDMGCPTMGTTRGAWLEAH